MTLHYLRLSIRSLLRAPGFAWTCILTVALAVGMATSVFGVVNAVLLRPLPYKDAGRLAIIWSSSTHEGRGPVSFDDFEDWRRNSKTLQSAALVFVLLQAGPDRRRATRSGSRRSSYPTSFSPSWPPNQGSGGSSSRRKTVMGRTT